MIKQNVDKDICKEDDDSETSEFVKDFERMNSLQKQKTMTLISNSFYAGPIPHPESFKEYDEILPKAADRILTIAENRQITDKN